jgi:hypothetical protein
MEFVTRPNGRLAEKDFDEERRVFRVVPKNDLIRKHLKHPTRGRMNAEGSTEWPNDQFTRRRIKEGDVTVEERAAPERRDEAQAVDRSGAKAAAPRTDKERTPTETSATVDPNRTTAPKI